MTGPFGAAFFVSEVLRCIIFGGACIMAMTCCVDIAFTFDGFIPAIRPSPTSQPPLHSRQTALEAVTFLPHGHFAMWDAQNSQGGFTQQVYCPLLAASAVTFSI